MKVNKSTLLSKSANSISVTSIRDFCKKKLKRIILDHLNINSIRSKFESEANSAEYEHFIIMGDFNTELLR